MEKPVDAIELANQFIEEISQKLKRPIIRYAKLDHTDPQESATLYYAQRCGDITALLSGTAYKTTFAGQERLMKDVLCEKSSELDNYPLDESVVYTVAHEINSPSNEKLLEELAAGINVSKKRSRTDLTVLYLSPTPPGHVLNIIPTKVVTETLQAIGSDKSGTFPPGLCLASPLCRLEIPLLLIKTDGWSYVYTGLHIHPSGYDKTEGAPDHDILTTFVAPDRCSLHPEIEAHKPEFDEIIFGMNHDIATTVLWGQTVEQYKIQIEHLAETYTAIKEKRDRLLDKFLESEMSKCEKSIGADLRIVNYGLCTLKFPGPRKGF